MRPIRKKALVVGGSRGLGFELVKEAVRHGIWTTVVSRRDMPKVAAEWPPAHHALDIMEPRDLQRLLALCKETAPDHFLWVAGAYHRAPIEEIGPGILQKMVHMHQTALFRCLQVLHAERKRLEAERPQPWRRYPYTVTVIGSTSSYRIRADEEAYAMAKAGQAQLLRTFSARMVQDLPGSRALLVNCGRLGETAGDTTLDAGGRRLDPERLARNIWNLLIDESRSRILNRPYGEISYERTSDEPNVSYGPKAPQLL